jgi:glycosyltransferase involved in cell wall biosynthesis
VSLPLVSCLMPTFGRAERDPAMLAECVSWFCVQDYAGLAELVILNDAPHDLVIDAPDVRVVNAPQRYPSLGAKYNALVRLARGDILLPWEDDDVSLPGRITQAVEKLGECDYWNPKGAWFQNGPDAPLTLCSPHSVHHNASAYRRSVWEAVGGYAEDRWGGVRQDLVFDRAVRAKGGLRVTDGFVAPADMTYVYRWGINPACPNLSGHPDPATGWAAEPAGTGRVIITPATRRDYAAEATRVQEDATC